MPPAGSVTEPGWAVKTGAELGIGTALTVSMAGVLVATAVLLGSWLANKRTRELGLSEEITEGAAGYAIVVGFVCAHLYSAIGYFPERIAANAASCSLAAKRCVITGATSRPLRRSAAILYQVSNISRP